MNKNNNQTNKQTNPPTNKQTNNQTNEQTNKTIKQRKKNEINKKTNKPTNNQTNKTKQTELDAVGLVKCQLGEGYIYNANPQERKERAKSAKYDKCEKYIKQNGQLAMPVLPFLHICAEKNVQAGTNPKS